MASAILRTLVATALLLASTSAAALIIRDDFTLSTTGQSMWSEGAEAVFSTEVFLGTRWGTYDTAAGPNPQPETIQLGGIAGQQNTPVPGTGGFLPNPGLLAWNLAMSTCTATGLLSRSQCINGVPAIRVCVGFICGTTPAIAGLGPQPPAEIPNPISAQFIDTRVGAVGGLDTSGEAGIIPWVEASGGGIDVSLPVGATLTLPDAIQAGTAFSVTTEMSVKNSAAITANAPSFKAGVDGLLNMENTFFGTACVFLTGCVTGEKDADVLAGRFGIIGIDTTQDTFLRVFGDDRGAGSIGVPGIEFNKQYTFWVPTPENPDGVDDETTPKRVPSPRLGDIEVGNLHDFTGGTLDGTQLALTTNQQLLSENVSVTGVAELFLASPGILSNHVALIPLLLDLGYTLLDLAVGPRYGMQQDFELTPDVWVALDFDQPVTRKSDGRQFDDGIVELALGDDVELLFDGEVGELVGRSFFMKAPQFSNETLATVDPGLKLEVGCISLPLTDLHCLFREDFTTTGLVGIPLYSDKWTLGGFNRVSLLGTASTGVGATGVPEPATVLLMAAGLLLMLALPRKRRREFVRVEF